MELPKVEPVFIRTRQIPDFKTLRDIELCLANIERSCLLGVQRIGMIWRVYLKDNASRVTLLANSVVVRE